MIRLRRGLNLHDFSLMRAGYPDLAMSRDEGPLDWLFCWLESVGRWGGEARFARKKKTFETTFGSALCEGWSYKFSGAGAPPPPLRLDSETYPFPSLSPLISLGAGG